MTRVVPIFDPSQLEQIARVLGETQTGLTGSEIGRTLAKIGVKDIDAKNTKWIRITNALGHRQAKDQSGDRFLAFIKAPLDPVQPHPPPDYFDRKRQNLNVVLPFAGLQYEE